MRLNQWAAAALIAGMLGGFAQSADANAIDVRATASGLTFRLVDLDPDDGVDPWIQFSGLSTVGLVMAQWQGTESIDFTPLAGTLFSAPAFSKSTPDGLFSLDYSPGMLNVQSRLTAAEVGALPAMTGTLLGRTGGIANFYGSGIDETAGLPLALDGEFALTLSARTALIVEASVNLSASALPGALADGTFAQQLSNNQLAASVSGSASFHMWLVSEVPPEVPEDFAALYPNIVSDAVAASFMLGGTEQPEAVERAMSFAAAIGYYNGSSDAVDINFDFVLSAYADVYAYEHWTDPVDPEWPPIDPPVDPGFPPVTPAIPEPSTYALMLLGLGGVVAAARQRQAVKNDKKT